MSCLVNKFHTTTICGLSAKLLFNDMTNGKDVIKYPLDEEGIEELSNGMIIELTVIAQYTNDLKKVIDLSHVFVACIKDDIVVIYQSWVSVTLLRRSIMNLVQFKKLLLDMDDPDADKDVGITLPAYNQISNNCLQEYLTLNQKTKYLLDIVRAFVDHMKDESYESLKIFNDIGFELNEIHNLENKNADIESCENTINNVAVYLEKMNKIYNDVLDRFVNIYPVLTKINAKHRIFNNGESVPVTYEMIHFNIREMNVRMAAQ
jgi:hypothetical protein